MGGVQFPDDKPKVSGNTTGGGASNAPSQPKVPISIHTEAKKVPAANGKSCDCTEVWKKRTPEELKAEIAKLKQDQVSYNLAELEQEHARLVAERDATGVTPETIVVASKEDRAKFMVAHKKVVENLKRQDKARMIEIRIRQAEEQLKQ